jgi:PTS system ascorbate-specific IIA component
VIGLFIVTHGSYGEALLQCACHVFRHRPPQLIHFGVTADDDPATVLPLAQNLLKLVDSNEGVLVLTDIFGATPANIAMKLLEPGRVEGLAGVNLPMLLRALSSRDQGMATLLERAASGGRDGVLNMLNP